MVPSIMLMKLPPASAKPRKTRWRGGRGGGLETSLGD